MTVDIRDGWEPLAASLERRLEEAGFSAPGSGFKPRKQHRQHGVESQMAAAQEVLRVLVRNATRARRRPPTPGERLLNARERARIEAQLKAAGKA